MAITGRISVQQILKVNNRPTCQHPVVLYWLNRLGGVEYFEFNGSFDDSIEIDGQVIASENKAPQDWRPYDVEYMRAFEKVLSRDSRDSITCFAGALNTHERETLKSLVDSPKVLLLTNPTTWDEVGGSGPAPIEVFIEGRSFNFGNKHQNLWDIYFTITKQPNVGINL